MIKLLMIGDSGVGKTCFLLRFADDNFTNSHLTTIGIDFKIKNLQVNDKNIKLQVWDTAGQERFRTITQTYYKGAMGIILAYDSTDESSFNNIRNWIQQIKIHASETVAKVLIGNKSDRADKKITSEQGEALAKELGIKFFETSAKTKVNVDETFFHITKEIMERKSNLGDMTGTPGAVHVGGAKPTGKKSCC